MRSPFEAVPTWDGKIVLAGIFIIGYYSLVWSMAHIGLPEGNKDIVRDAMLQLGPPIGVIIGALFRSTAAEERREALRSSEVRAALEAPTVANGDMKEAVQRGVAEGVAEAEPVAVKPAPMAADGEHRDWLDGPRAGDADPWPSK